MARSKAASVRRWKVASTDSTHSTKYTVALKSSNNKIFFDRVDATYQDKAGQYEHSDNPGYPITLLTICEREPEDYEAGIRRSDTQHYILSDGNILRKTIPRKFEFTVVDPVDRVFRAILGTILSHCDKDHVLDPRALSKGSTRIKRFVFNRHELLKAFWAIQSLGNIAGQPCSEISLWAYSQHEIDALVQSVYRCGRTFSVKPVTKAQQQVYLRNLRHNKSLPFRSTRPEFSSNPMSLMLLAHVAGMVDEKDRKRSLYWN